MILTKTFLDKTEKRGIGVFSAEFLPKGTIWWREDDSFDKIFDKKQYESMSHVQQNFLKTYAAHENENRWYLCIDNARFVNHSRKPNTSLNEDQTFSVTLCDILEGEEITADYTIFDIDCLTDLGFQDKE